MLQTSPLAHNSNFGLYFNSLTGVSPLAHNSDFGLYFNSLTGVSPFWNNDPDITLSNVTRAEWNLPDILFQDVSDEAKDFLSKVLVKDPR